MLKNHSKNVFPQWKKEKQQILVCYRSFMNKKDGFIFRNVRFANKNVLVTPKVMISKVKPPSSNPVIFYIFPGIAVCLGIWQIRRREWKLNLIHELKTKVNFPPIDLPDDVTSGYDLAEYQPIKVRGKFDHSKEIIVGPVTFNPDFDPHNLQHRETESNKKKSKISSGVEPRGYHVVTPLSIEKSKDSILVNRGWVPETQKDPNTRKSGQISGTVEVIGLVRHGSPGFCNSRTGVYNQRNIEEMATKTGSLPLFLDSKYDPNIKFGPVGGQTLVNLRNTHLEYSIFWFTMAGALFAFIRYSVK